jgi:hypothetical protein
VEDGMTVGDLRKIIENLPDDMIIATYDHGYLDIDFTGAEVIKSGEKYPVGEPEQEYLLIY